VKKNCHYGIIPATSIGDLVSHVGNGHLEDGNQGAEEVDRIN
jgi:hypothetical protein